MSLEAAIAKLTSAVEANTAALGAGGGTSKPAGKPAAGGKKPAAGGKKPVGKKATSADDLAAAFGEFMKEGTAAERKEAKATVRAIIEYMDVERITHLEEDRFDEALGYLKAFQNGEDPFGGEEGEEGEDLM